jgi:hypothetical protein
MKNKIFPSVLALVLLCLFVGELRAQTTTNIVKAVLVVTNGTVTSNKFVLNGRVLTFTNATTASTVLTNGTGNGSATNLINQLGYWGAPGVFFQQTNTNTIVLFGAALTVSVTGNWASLVLTTNLGTNGWGMGLPYDNLPALQRTNNANEIAYGFKYSATAVETGTVAMAKWVDKSSVQAFGLKRLTNSTVADSTLTNVTPTLLTGGYWTNGALDNPNLTNGVNRGNAFDSPGVGVGSLQLGAGALATNTQSIAVGPSARAYGAGGTALGYAAYALTSGTALGAGAAAWTNAVAIGPDSAAVENSSIAIGAGAVATHPNSVSIGTGSATTATNQIMLGTASIDVRVNNVFSAGSTTNSTLTGTNTVSGDWADLPYDVTGLANTNNVIDPAGHTYLRLSGPSQGFNIIGIKAGRPGQKIEIENPTGFPMMLSHLDGGTGLTNRFNAGKGGAVVLTNNPSSFMARYNGTNWLLRWKTD